MNCNNCNLLSINLLNNKIQITGIILYYYNKNNENKIYLNECCILKYYIGKNNINKDMQIKLFSNIKNIKEKYINFNNNGIKIYEINNIKNKEDIINPYTNIKLNIIRNIEYNKINDNYKFITKKQYNNLINTIDINNRINNEICNETINKLKDINLLNEYKECKSVKNEIQKLTQILKKYEINNNKIKLIINDYLLELIPAGTKGIIRGNLFNKIVKNIIDNIKLDKNKFEINYEKQCNIYIMTEIPDWYIFEKSTNRVIIGMNQLDLWGGGQQLNRGSKYLINNINNNNCKLLCVICNPINFINNNTKAYKLFEIGFKNNTLCYIKNIENIILKYFHL